MGDRDNVPALVSRASTAAGVHPKAQGQQITRLLDRLHAIPHDVAELRNAVGDGYGTDHAPAGLTPARGRLAARSAVAWCTFVLKLLRR